VSGAYRVRGAEDLTRTLHDAADDLDDLGAAAKRAGDTVVGAARGRAPRRSGALGASLYPVVTTAGISVRARVDYAGPIHWGWPARSIAPQPFLSEAATRTESTWVDYYADAVKAAVNQVHGA
jgi:hypothetical protein